MKAFRPAGKQYGGMASDKLKKLRWLRKEHERLRKALSDLTPYKLILPETTKGNSQDIVV